MDKTRTFRPLILAGAVALASLAAILPVQAGHHGGEGHGGRLERHLERMTERLGLEDDQVDLVRDVLEDSRAQAREIEANSRDERRAAMRTLREDTEERLAGILTPVQMQMLEEARAEGREARRDRMESHREQRFATLVEELELAETQIDPVREILEGGMARGRAVMEAARSEDGDRDALRERVRGELDAIRAQTRAELAGVLTTDQLERFEALEAERRDGHGRHRGMRHRGGI